jgi:tetratricopeptide (TPR) repeat protein
MSGPRGSVSRRVRTGGGETHASWVAAALLALLAQAGNGCTMFGSDEVVRKVHGKTLTGRFISPDAYGHFVQGAVLEAQGDLEGAQKAYGAAALGALEEPEPWIRLGAVQCRLGKDPTNTFERARQRDDRLASLWYERAHCFLLANKPDRAVADAERALTLGPSDANNSILLYKSLLAADRKLDADRVLRAMVARWPDDARVAEWSRAAALSITPAALPHRVAAPKQADVDTASVDVALRRGDDEGARQAARVGHVPLASLALRAVALGRVALAAQTARLVLAADPSSADARIAVLASADLARDDAAFSFGLASFVGNATPPSPLGVALLQETLRRRAPQEALALPMPAEPTDDPLLLAVLARGQTPPSGQPKPATP